MLDFLTIRTKVDNNKRLVKVYPAFIVKKSKDLMIKGKAFFAIWDEENHQWSTSEYRAVEIMDKLISEKYEKVKDDISGYETIPEYIDSYENKRLVDWQSYCKSLPDNYKSLDSSVIFEDQESKKEDYSSKHVPYKMSEGSIDNYDLLMSTLYEPKERDKLEWMIGSIIAGDSKDIQKFIVMYGDPGSGKSTVLDILKMLFPGYYTMFESKALGTGTDAFVLEAFKDNPLIAMDDEGDLSRIEDNTRLNSIVAHAEMIVNEKRKSRYTMRFNSMLVIASNKPVKITDAKSGIIRRLIDVTPTGNKLTARKYEAVMEHLSFELGAIANHCYEKYKSMGKNYYKNYIAMDMISRTNDIYNFIDDNIDKFLEYKDQIQLKLVWQWYKEYAEDANLPYSVKRTVLRDEMKNYYEQYDERLANGLRQVFSRFKSDKFSYDFTPIKEPKDETPSWLVFDQTESILDKLYSDCKAQYANGDGKPTCAWDECETRLKDIDTSRLHYTMVPDISHVVMDFDKKNSEGKKDFLLNMEAASKFPPTYAELSKSGQGIHLHYIYEGDVNELKRVFDEDIEIKIFTGKSSLRRQLTKCNNLPIAKISSGLPKKGANTMVNQETMKNEKQLRALIKNCLEKKHHGATAPEVSYIYDTLNKCYDAGMAYDVTDLRDEITAFANNSTNQSLNCLKLVTKMRWKGQPYENETAVPGAYTNDAPIIFFDCEVFPNLFILCWKLEGENNPVVRMINPSPAEVEQLFKYRMIGYNCRRYDNHILMARAMGYSLEELYHMSAKIVSQDKKDKDKSCYISEAYNLSYTDIYDYAATKQSLKKWEIELSMHHLENNRDWNQPLPEEYWEEVTNYCCNDVIATEAVHNHLKGDFEARLILAELAGMTPNDTTNSLTTRLIVGKDPHPQDKFIYTDLSKEFPGYRFDEKGIPVEEYDDIKQIVQGKSIYLGKDPSEGGYVSAVPGIYRNVALLDVASLHPSSAINLKIFGEEYTANYARIKQIRIYIKHKEYDKVRNMFDGKLAKYLEDESQAKALAQALKIAINSVYGLTSAKFPNKLRDPRNVDNIVAKRGALFMMTLEHEVIKRGFTVAHVKTDSIKIPDATPEIIQFVMDFGKKYGYDFEHEATYERMCLVNDSTYIARYENDEKCKQMYGYIPEKNEKHPLGWTATGAEFQVPYIFKTLFSHEPLEFKDYCQTKQATKGEIILDFNEGLTEDEHNYKFIGKIGEFVPIAAGYGGGILYRYDGEKYSAVTGTKGYRWIDSETCKKSNMEPHIDKQYFTDMATKAIEHINEFGDYEWFVSTDSDDIKEAVKVDPIDSDEVVPFEPDIIYDSFADKMNPPIVA